MRTRHLAAALALAALPLTACGAAQPAAGREPLPATTRIPDQSRSGDDLCKAIAKLDANQAMRNAQEGAAGMRRAAGTFDQLAAAAPADVAADLTKIAAAYRGLADGKAGVEQVKTEVEPLFTRYLDYVAKHCARG
ncbi:MAG: hypothetical protein HOY71_36690 [Nonomuraea sp.]|nr:hypothetical protein [Nonomuraea sp.]